MLPQCDFVCVVVALTETTKEMIKYEHFKLMKRSAIFCNISRGGTVQQDDLVKDIRLIAYQILKVATTCFHDLTCYFNKQLSELTKWTQETNFTQ